jgi:DNA-binding GntR family transcriptional regulator
MPTPNVAAADPLAIETTPSTLRTHVVKVIRGEILSGKYQPGDRLNESKIARELNISRIPVREALSQLQDQGLVMNHQRRGMFVTHLSVEEVQQINSLRIILETEALRLARARMTPEVRAKLTGLVEQMEAWDGSLLDAAALDLEFHREIWRASGNPYLEKTLEGLATALFAHKAIEHVSQEIRRWRLNHHRALLDVVADPNSGDPQSAILTHLRMAYTEPERFSSLAVQDAPAPTPARATKIKRT